MSDDAKRGTPPPTPRSLPIAPDELKLCKAAAITLVQRCVRNTQLENLHAGIFPASQTGDYADVKSRLLARYPGTKFRGSAILK